MNFLLEPFGRLVDEELTNVMYNSVKLDAIYIPSLSQRYFDAKKIFLLKKYARNIVFLYSNDFKVSPIISSMSRVENIYNYYDFVKWYTSRTENRNIGIQWRESFDIPHKRSFALADARMHGYRYIMLLDDDLTLVEKNLEIGIMALQLVADVVGFHVIDYPDVSTIDHLERKILNAENTISMTGSCLLLNMDKVAGDFPNIYNEDLFFFLAQPDQTKVVSAGKIYQDEYSPWLDIKRVCHEQFGDLIYDAIKKKLVKNEIGKIIWEEEIDDRIERITRIKMQAKEKTQVLALDNAIEVLNSIQVKNIMDFINNYSFSEFVRNSFFAI